MKDFNWQQVNESFATASVLKGIERREFLDSIGSENKILQSEVISLLSAEDLGDVLPNSTATMLEDTESLPLWGGKNPNDKRLKSEMINETLENRYLIVKHIGGGGMGEVFLAQDQNVMNREVIVKLLRNDALENSEIVRKFKQEVEALARIKDEGIVTIYDFGTYGEQPFLVLEYVEGEDLSKIISPVLFGLKDFIAPETIAEKLLEQKSPELSQVWTRISPETKEYLQNPDTELTEKLREEFSRLLRDWSLYNESAFAGFHFSPKTAELLKQREANDRTIEFNRALLEDLFPAEIVKGDTKRLNAEQIADVFSQLCVALSQGHRKGIIHRDLKPANIMLTENEGRGLRVKLIDFGVARVHESLVAPTTRIGMLFGTQNYMSPEQLNGETNLTAAVDIYALGLIALEMLAGRNPFSGKNSIEQYRLQENVESEDFAGENWQLPPGAANVIRKALAFKPENRFASAQDFGKALAESLRQEADIYNSESKKSENSELPTQKIKIAHPTLPPVIPDSVVTQDHRDVSKFPIITPASGGYRNGKSGSKLWTPLASLVILAMISSVGWWIWKQANQEKTPTAAEVVPNAAKEKRELNYKLIVQKYYEGKPFQKPFEATGDEIFGDGWRFYLNLTSPQEGNLYLLTEGAGDNGKPELVMLFPHPQKNDGKSFVKGNQTIETNEMEFDKNQGAEKFWIVWSKNPVDKLEAVKSYVNPKDLGTIKDAEKEKSVRDFLNSKSAENKAAEKTSGDKTSKNLLTTDGVLVKMAEFRHN